MTQTITTLLTLGLAVTLLVVGTPALIRWYTTRLQRARAHIQIRENLQAHLNRQPLPDMPPRKLTDEEKQRLTEWRVSKGIRERANAPYEKQERGA